MATEFDSEEQALMIGMYYAGREDLYLNKGPMTMEKIKTMDEIEVIKNSKINQLGSEVECITIQFLTKSGKLAQVASAPFRSGFDCWLINPKNGMGKRCFK